LSGEAAPIPSKDYTKASWGFWSGVTIALIISFGVRKELLPPQQTKVDPSFRQQLRKEAGASYPMRNIHLRHSAEGIWLTKAISESSLLRKTRHKKTRPRNKPRKSKKARLFFLVTVSPYISSTVGFQQ